LNSANTCTVITVIKIYRLAQLAYSQYQHLPNICRSPLQLIKYSKMNTTDMILAQTLFTSNTLSHD